MMATIRRTLGSSRADSPAPQDRQAYQPIRSDDGVDDEDANDEVHRQTAITGKVGIDDRGTYWAFWILGAGVLLSWNVLICSFPIFMVRFLRGSDLRYSIASWLSSVYCLGNLVFLGVAQRSIGKSSPIKQINASLLLLLAISLTFGIPILLFVLPAIEQPLVTFAILVVTALGLSISTAYLQAAVFALAALWGSDETLAVMSGQGGIAVLVSGVQFVLAVMSSLSRPAGNPNIEDPSMSAVVALWVLTAAASLVCMSATKRLTLKERFLLISHRPAPDPTEDIDQSNSKHRSRRVFWKNSRLELAVAWVFIVTLSVFPPVTTTITSVRHPVPALLQPSIFIPLHFFLFNVGDYIGRTFLPSIPALLVTSQTSILVLSLGRTLFIPIFMMCNVYSGHGSPIINSDVAYSTILLAFGTSNGWISSLCMITASTPALNPKIEGDEKDIAGGLAAFCLVCGLAGGSVASFGVKWVLGSLVS